MIQQGESIAVSAAEPKSPSQDPEAWKFLFAFAEGCDSMTMPVAIAMLEAYLAEKYRYEDWKPAFNAVFNAESDVPAAVKAVQDLACKAQEPTPLSANPSTLPFASPSVTGPPVAPQLEFLEKSLMNVIDDLQKRNRIRGTALTLEELVNPIEEQEVGDSPYRFPGGDTEIVAEAKRLVAEKNGEAVAVTNLTLDDDDDDDEEDPAEDCVSSKEGIELCEKLEKLCLVHTEAEGVGGLKVELENLKLKLKSQVPA
ncbi:hypothetical protein DFH11DRAFT_1552179 [Phellopilus nigrolimitatus]|nr:hypothetical protein DFH11DRAFT_1552179 [Phellopilus nigrolimitatus]